MFSRRSLFLLLFFVCSQTFLAGGQKGKKRSASDKIVQVQINADTPAPEQPPQPEPDLSITNTVPQRLGIKEAWMSYNLQNLFDGQCDGTEYQTFSQQQWSEYYAELKVLQISRVFAEIEKERGNIGLVLLQEVENVAVLERLRINTPSLERLHIIFARKPDQATGVAIMTYHPVKKVEQLDSSLFDAQSRPVLIATLNVNNEEVLVINVHLPSQKNADNTHKRTKALALISERVQKAIAAGQTVFLGGDFNQDLMGIPSKAFPYLDTPHFNSQQLFFLVNGYSLVPHQFQYGTYVHEGIWQKLDYLFFSINKD